MRENEAKPAAGTAGQGLATSGAVRHSYYTQSGKIAATLEGRTLRKRVRASVHMLRRPPAWAIDRSILEAARRDGAVVVEIFDTESRRVFTAPIVAFDLHGLGFNRGFGDQVALPLAHWRVEAVNARQLEFFTTGA